MPKARNPNTAVVANTESLYSRGGYRLEWDRKRDGNLRTPFLQIVWYDAVAGRNRSKSAGTADVSAAEFELDKLYLQRERGQAICAACGQPIRASGRHFLSSAISDYLVARSGRSSIGSIKPRLAHVQAFIEDTVRLETACEDVDDDWIEEFREWAMEIPVVSPNGSTRDRAPGTVEASVRQLAAVINFAFGRKEILHPATFKVKKPSEVDQTPTYRADIGVLAAMFRYAMKPGNDGQPMRARGPLLRFLQISILTWCRPDAAHDFSVDAATQQWLTDARVANLNPKGRPQTRKHRPAVPIGDRGADLFDHASGFFVGVASVKHSFATMLDDLGLPRQGETGMKVIRRSMSTLGRKRLGEEHYVQVERMLGHRKSSTSDVYALFEPGMLGRALNVTDGIIAEIEKLAPGAFHRNGTGLRIIKGAANVA